MAFVLASRGFQDRGASSPGIGTNRFLPAIAPPLSATVLARERPRGAIEDGRARSRLLFRKQPRQQFIRCQLIRCLRDRSGQLPVSQDPRFPPLCDPQLQVQRFGITGKGLVNRFW
jgi:hypothetical protein